MQGVAVAEAGREQAGAVMVDHHGAVDDLVETVIVHVRHRQVVVALAGERVVAVLGVEDPAGRELAVAEIPGGQHGAAVVAAAHHHAREFAVEVGHAGQEAVDAVAVGVVAAVAAPAAPAVQGAARRDIVDRGQRLAGLAAEHREVLGTRQDLAVAVAPVLGAVADDVALGVLGAIAGLAGELGLAVTVQVRDHELGVVRTLADVHAQVDLPQEGAVQFVGLEDRNVRESVGGIVDAAAGHVDDDLVVAVTIQVTHAAVVGRIAVRSAHRDGDILLHGRIGGQRECLAGRGFLALLHGADEPGIGPGQVRRPVDEMGGARQGLVVQLDRLLAFGLAVYVESQVGGLGPQQAPGHEHAVILPDGDDAPAQVFHLALGERARRQAEAQSQHQAFQNK